MPIYCGITPSSSLLKLFYRIDDSLKCLRIVHGKVCENLTVQTNVLLSDASHELRISHTVLTCGSVDSLDPECAECTLLVLTVTVCIGKTLLIGVLCYRPYVLSSEEITAGSLKNLLAACP